MEFKRYAIWENCSRTNKINDRVNDGCGLHVETQKQNDRFAVNWMEIMEPWKRKGR